MEDGNADMFGDHPLILNARDVVQGEEWLSPSEPTFRLAGLLVQFNCWALDKMVWLHWNSFVDWKSQRIDRDPGLYRFITDRALEAAEQALIDVALKDPEAAHVLPANLSALEALRRREFDLYRTQHHETREETDGPDSE